MVIAYQVLMLMIMFISFIYTVSGEVQNKSLVYGTTIIFGLSNLGFLGTILLG